MRFARIEGGKVVEIIEPGVDEKGNEIPIEERFHADIVGQLIDVTGFPGVEPGWNYDGVTAAAPVTPPPTAIEIEAAKIAAAEDAIEQMLDIEAKKKGYDDIRSAALRAGYPGPFHDEGVAFATWMDSCWAKCYEILAAVKAGTRPEPTVPELLAEMPPLVLP